MAKTNRNKPGPRQPIPKKKSAPEEPLELLPPTIPKSPEERWSPILVIMVLVFAAYTPTLNNEFVSWDDDHYIFDNRQVSEPDGLKSIWFDVFHYSDKRYRRNDNASRVSHQYYPIVFTTHWLEYRLFGGDDSIDANDRVKGIERARTIEEQIDKGAMSHRGFHVTNTLLHMVNVMVMVFMFRALGLSSWVAWAATILFALHPMQTASVAWTAERKNILSLMFYMLSIISYVHMRRSGGWWRYVLSILFFQLALFSKTVALTLPVTLFFTDRLLERRWEVKYMLQSMVRMLPMLALTAIAAWTTMSVEDRNRTIPLTEDQRPFLPCASLLFYVKQMLFPINQSPIYKLWSPDPQIYSWQYAVLALICLTLTVRIIASPKKLGLPLNWAIRTLCVGLASAMGSLWIAPILIVLVLTTAIIIFRKRLGPHFIWGVLMYCVIMGPMLGFKNINYFQFAFVADHYFYHGAMGLCLLLGLGADALRRRIKPERRGTQIMTTVVLLLGIGYGVRTYFYSQVWKTSDTFWERTLTINPDCWPGHFNLANDRVRMATETQGQDKKNELYDYAIGRYKEVARINKKIVQPIDQWIKICRIRSDWKGMVEAAIAGFDRFAHIPRYAFSAGTAYARLRDTKNAEKWYKTTVKIAAQQPKKMDMAIDASLQLGALTGKAGRLEESARHFLKAAQFAEILGDNSTKRKKPCTAKKWYAEGRKIVRMAPPSTAAAGELQTLDRRLTDKQKIAASQCSN